MLVLDKGVLLCCRPLDFVAAERNKRKERPPMENNKKPNTFPKELIVLQDGAKIFTGGTSLEDIDCGDVTYADGDAVAVYKLVKTGHVQIKSTLIFAKN